MGNEQSRPVACCCQDTLPIQDAERNIDDDQPKYVETILNKTQSEYMNKSVVSTFDTTNSYEGVTKYESTVMMVTEEESDKEQEKQQLPREEMIVEQEIKQNSEKEQVNTQQIEQCDEKTMLTEDIEYFSIIEKYKNLIKEANLLEDLESKIELIKKPIEEGMVLTNVTYDKEKDLKFKVTIKEHIIETVRHHELLQEFQLKNVDPLQYTLCHILMDHKDMTRFDDKTESHRLLCHYEEDGVFYYVHRIVAKKNIFMNGKELILANAFKKLDNGKFVDVFKSIEDPDFVRGDKKIGKS